MADEMFRNGGANWGAEFRKMVDSAAALMGTRAPLPPQELADLHALAPQVRTGKGREPDLDRFSELAVHWVLRNPDPQPLRGVRYTW